MGRKARKISSSGVYHILFRGVNHCHLFETNDDYAKILSILQSVMSELRFNIYAYVLMSNHVHLLLHESAPGDIIRIMRKVLTQYAGWFNRKYERSGALIANRYKSECVEDDSYLFSVMRYIHQNPVKAGIVQDPKSYRWSSYREYIDGTGGIVRTDYVLEMLASKNSSALAEFTALHMVMEPEYAIMREQGWETEAQLHVTAVELLGYEPNKVAGMTRAKRNEAIALMRTCGFSIRQIERLTGVPKSVIARETVR